MFNRLLIAAFATLFSSVFVSAEDDGAKARFTKLATEIASEYTIKSAERLSELQQEPVLTWTDPENGEVYGAVFVWTDGGRPTVIASIYKWYQPYTHSTHEFQSLSSGPIVGLRDNQNDWRCSKPGVDWKPVPGAPAPGRTRAQRLTQMRLIAKRFSLQMTDKEGSVETLRILSQPLYRFPNPAGKSHLAGNVADSALFAFARGTDPEALLLLEFRNEEDKKPTLYYAWARSNFLPMAASYDGEPVWEVDRLARASMKSGAEPYTKFIFQDAAEESKGTR